MAFAYPAANKPTERVVATNAFLRGSVFFMREILGFVAGVKDFGTMLKLKSIAGLLSLG